MQEATNLSTLSSLHADPYCVTLDICLSCRINLSLTPIHHDGTVETPSRITSASGTPLWNHHISSTHRPQNDLSGILAHTKPGLTPHIWTFTIYRRLATQNTQRSSSGEGGCEKGHKVCLSVLISMTIPLRHHLTQKTWTIFRTYI